MVLFSATESDAYIYRLKGILEGAKNDKQLFNAIVNAPFTDKYRATLLGIGIVVLLMVDEKTKMIDRVALSETELAKDAVRVSVKPFRDIKIPLNYRGNFIAEAIRSGRYQQTGDWQYLFMPALTPEQARINQVSAGISCSYVYPLLGARAGGSLIFSFFTPLEKIKPEHHHFMQAYSKLAASQLKKV